MKSFPCRSGFQVILLTLFFFSISSMLPVLGGELSPEEVGQGLVYSIVTGTGERLATTRYRPLVGDEYVTADNRLYRIHDVTAYTATASLQEVLDFSHEKTTGILSAQKRKGSIGIFHTHNAESYIPTDGTHSIHGKGGIHAVGHAFANRLEELGVESIFSEELHLPHDRGAYRRSRETVLEIIGKEPDAIFDLHRNAAPYAVYHHEHKEEELTHLQFVVGLLNPHAQVNRAFSYDLKNITNSLFPELVKGIFFTQGGNFNQDLYPTLLLVEVGAQSNPREAAERSIQLFAEGVYHYFYGWEGVTEDPKAAAPLVRTVGRTVLWILLFTLAGGILFLVINSRDIEDFRSRLAALGRGLKKKLQHLIKRRGV